MKNIVLGTMTFGEKTDSNESKKILSAFLHAGYKDVDTAYVYNNGLSESIIGEFILESGKKFTIATKVNPKVTGSLNEQSIIEQVKTSLKRLNVNYIDLLYLHFPDPNTSLYEILMTCNNLYKEGKIKAIGLSNFSSDMVEEICCICDNEGWIKPIVYEGVYNILNRNVEETLFKVLSKWGISFYCYNPLAGGLLTGKYKNMKSLPTSGRFVNRPNYYDRYWTKENWQAIKMLNEVCEKNNVSLLECSFIWLHNHSNLSVENGDKIIIGVSSKSQFIQNIQIDFDKKLTTEILNVIDEVWEIVSKNSMNYFRYVKGVARK